ncbi:MAG: EAL domain-containing protein [Oscillospiraceae bacterium]|nr:EAL domain-containing protein [Oscillospiraceae bacterium]
MINDKKIIGVCSTKIHDSIRADYLNRLHHLSQKSGYKLIIFNSYVDFYRHDDFDRGAESVYNIINYDVIDALVVLYDSFYDKDIASRIIEKAAENNVPVITVNAKTDGCSSVTADYSSALKDVLSHVIREHNVRDTFFIAGNPKNDPESVKRIACYKEALEENDLIFDEKNIGYGGYWEDPTRRIMHRIIESGKLPEAIFCANDYMAFAVCRELDEHGYSVPEDVIVTGFDGIAEAKHFSPQLTTCTENIETLAELTVSAADAVIAEPDKQVHFVNSYVPSISESCGCTKLASTDFRSIASELYSTIHEMEMHEDFEYAWIDHMLEINDIQTLYSTLAGCIQENSCVCVSANFLSFAIDPTREGVKNKFSDELVVIPSAYSNNMAEKTGKIKLSDMIPNCGEWLESDDSYVINSIYVGSEVCGYYAVRSNNIPQYSHKIKRVLKTINIAFSVAINYFKQAKMRRTMENAALTNPLTGLPNIKGAAKWFEEFAAAPGNHKHPLTFSVYALPKYTYIYENYGISEAEGALRFVAEALKLANPVDCYIAHIAEDEFLIINYYDSPDTIGDVIGKATSVFFSIIEDYNTDSGKEYYVEVNCGCAEAHSDWQDSLESYIKFANAEMYMNRLKSGMGSAVKEQASPKEHYKMFDLLIEKNLFNYHFQPIVSAKTGDIIAYEALMRTDASIGMNPLEVLDAAKEYGRLYDIEKATMFNVMERFISEQDQFKDKMVFINTIPGHFLKNKELEEATKRYGKYMDRVVFELTEQGTVSDDELNVIKNLSSDNLTSQIAIDDYGTGHSNIVNLMRYTPQVIKLDRFLISDIHKDGNKQMFVRSTVEFAKINHIQVLAEGVETSNEMRMVIDLGVDFIQGYYTGRPAPQPIQAINEDIRREIINANPLFGQN